MRLPIDLVLTSLLQLTPPVGVAMEPPRTDLREVAAPALPAPGEGAPSAEAGRKPEPGPWSGSITLGLDWLAGNSKSLTLILEGLVDYNSSRWLLTAEADGEYVTAAVPGEDSRDIAAKAEAWARGERRVTPVFSGFLYAGIDSNHFASLELRLEAQGGLGVTALERRPGAPDQLVLRFYVGPHYSRDRRFQYYPTHQDVPDQNVWSPGVALSFRAGLNEHVKLLEDAFVFPAPSRVLVRSQTRLRTSLTSYLALSAEFLLEANSAPAPGKAVADTTLLLGLTLEI
jgi:hypothetical protein